MRWVAVLGDAADPHAWSGIPWHFLQAAQRAGFVDAPLRLAIADLAWPRRRWAATRVAHCRRPAGFQYSAACLDRLEAQLPPEALAGEIISFSQHFPRAATVRRAGGRISYYIDATFAALASGRGLDLQLPVDVVEQTCRLERENYAQADRVVTMARWAAESALVDCSVPRERVFTVLPGANLDLPDDWTPEPLPGLPGRDRPLVLGFVGKDWQRKGLPFLCDVRDALAARGCRAVVRAAGEAPAELARRDGVEFRGFLDKHSDPAGFAAFLASCDVGCLFSEREALGISTLEFLRVGVPVAGFAVEGPADALPADAGFRFAPGSDPATVAAALHAAIADSETWSRRVAAARAWSSAVTWDRCVRELQSIWAGASDADAVKPWLGLPADATTNLAERCAARQ